MILCHSNICIIVFFRKFQKHHDKNRSCPFRFAQTHHTITFFGYHVSKTVKSSGRRSRQKVHITISTIRDGKYFLDVNKKKKKSRSSSNVEVQNKRENDKIRLWSPDDGCRFESPFQM